MLTESLFAKSDEPFFNSIGEKQTSTDRCSLASIYEFTP